MSTSSFAYPVALPVIIAGEEKSSYVWCDGLIYGRHSYDGTINKVEITPTVRANPDWILTQQPIGESYWIGERHLSRLMWESNPRSSHFQEHAWPKAKAGGRGGSGGGASGVPGGGAGGRGGAGRAWRDWPGDSIYYATIVKNGENKPAINRNYTLDQRVTVCDSVLRGQRFSNRRLHFMKRLTELSAHPRSFTVEDASKIFFALRNAHADLRGMVERQQTGIEVSDMDFAAARKTIAEIEELVDL